MPQPMKISRRQMLMTSGCIVTAMTNPQFAYSQAEAKDLIFRTTDPRNAEPALEKLVQSWITPTKHFYVRSHAPNPVISPDNFELKIEGSVRKPMTLRLGDLKKFDRQTQTATLTCAGNRRAEFNKEGKVGGVQWEAGAIGNATWGGYALADILNQAELLESARHIWFEGLDEIKKGDGIIPFGGSIPIEKAMFNDGPGTPLIADTMNDAPLTPDHGYPLRTLVPGYIGARSVKWLGKIIVSDRPSPNHYVATAYKLVKKTDPIDWNESGPIYRFPINAAICTPIASATLGAGTVEVTGYALPTGRPGSRIKRIHVSTNPNKKWQKATLVGDNSDFCWQLWKATVPVDGQTKQIIVKAEDTAGGFMPYRVPWNAKGYLHNSWYRLPVKVG